VLYGLIFEPPVSIILPSLHKNPEQTRWRSDCRLFGAIGKKYKLFLMGNEAKTDGVGI